MADSTVAENGPPSKRLRSMSMPNKMDARTPKRKKRRSSRSASVKVSKAPVALQNEWTFWYDEKAARGMKHVDYENSMKQVGTFSTVQDFWRYWNNIVDPTQFPMNSNLRLFKSSVKPLWEDEGNVRGGKWTLSSKRQNTSRTWMSLMLAVIGEQFKFSDEICGLVLSIRGSCDVISVWNRDSSNAAVREETTSDIQALLNLSKPPEYRPHTGAMELNQSCRHQKHVRRQSTGGRPSRHPGLSQSTGAVNNLLSRTPSEPVLHRRHGSHGGGAQFSLRDESESEQDYSDYSSSAMGSTDEEYSESDASPEHNRHISFAGIRTEEEELYLSSEDELSSSGEKSSSFGSSPFLKKREAFKKHRKTHSDSTHQRGRLVHSASGLSQSDRRRSNESREQLSSSSGAVRNASPSPSGRVARKPHWKTHHRKAASAEDGAPPPTALGRNMAAVATQSPVARSASPVVAADEYEERSALTSSQQRAFTSAPRAPIYPPSTSLAFTVGREKRRRTTDIVDDDWLGNSTVLLLGFVLIGFVVVVLSSMLVAIVQLDESESIILF